MVRLTPLRAFPAAPRALRDGLARFIGTGAWPPLAGRNSFTFGQGIPVFELNSDDVVSDAPELLAAMSRLRHLVVDVDSAAYADLEIGADGSLAMLELVGGEAAEDLLAVLRAIDHFEEDGAFELRWLEAPGLDASAAWFVGARSWFFPLEDRGTSVVEGPDYFARLRAIAEVRRSSQRFWASEEWVT